MRLADILIEGNDFKSLQKYKKPLTDDKRTIVMKSKATWHHGPNGEETPAVWKSIDKKGKETFVTHTRTERLIRQQL